MNEREPWKRHRKAHCPGCSEIRRYAISAAPGKRLREQRCQSCGATLGRQAGARAMLILKMFSKSKGARVGRQRQPKLDTRNLPAPIQKELDRLIAGQLGFNELKRW